MTDPRRSGAGADMDGGRAPMTHERRVASPLGHATVSLQERHTIGKSKRALVPRSSHGSWQPSARRPDPVALLAAQEADRLPDLVPLRHTRMAIDPFAFFRGAAAVMAWDLAHAPHTDLYVQMCGDAHLMNFGIFAAPSRELVFDVNDFDETLPGPWEFDLKRLTASLVIAAQTAGFRASEAEAAVRNAVRSYRDNVVRYAGLADLDVWYSRIRMSDVRRIAASDAQLARRVDRVLARATGNTAERAYARIVETVGDSVRFRSDPPTMVRVADLPPDLAGSVEAEFVEITRYLRSLPEHLRVLLGRYETVDSARKVVGVGSVGTQDYVVLLRGRRMGDPLILQIKQAVRSVHEEHLRPSRYRSHGARVVAGQHLVQAASDPFLGWFSSRQGSSFYVRQFSDAKGGLDLSQLTPKVLAAYGALCAWVLGRAHARSGDSMAISGYLGEGTTFEEAMVAYSFRYAEQNLADHERFCATVLPEVQLPDPSSGVSGADRPAP